MSLLPRSEAERTLDGLTQRARLGIALGLAAFVVLVRQSGAAPDDLVARGFVIAAAFFLAAVAHELPARFATRGIARASGVLADLGATAVAVVLLADVMPLAPVAFLWPVFTAALVAPTLYALAVAALGATTLFAIVLARGTAVSDALTAGQWGLLYFGAAAAQSAILRQFRRAQRATESAMTRAADLAYCTSAEQVGEILFGFVDALLGTSDRPAALLQDRRGGAHVAVAARGLDPEARARLRLLAGEQGDALGIVPAGGLWTEPGRLGGALALSGALAGARQLFVLPLREDRRLIGALLLAAERPRALSDEAQRGVERVAAQAAGALQRLRSARLVEQQRAAMSFLLDVRRAGDDAAAIATWAVRAARDLTDASGAAIVARENDRYRALAGVELGDDVIGEAAPLLDAIFGRRAPVVIADLASDRRFTLGAGLRTGSVVAVPIHGEGAVLLVRDKRVDAVSSANVELLIMLADQVALLLARAHVVRQGGVRDERGAVGEIADILGGPRAELQARVVEALRLAIEGNQPDLAGSGVRVGRLASAIAERIGTGAEERDQIYVAALLRDVGQLRVDRTILEQPRPLRSDELSVVHQHPALGEAILASLGFLGPAARIVRCHHERFDGSGYPDGLSGDAIPLGARILAVADAFHAMTSERPYRTAFSPLDAVRTIADAAGHAFDPAVVEAFATLAQAQPLDVVS